MQGEPPAADGARHLHFRFGPIRVRPGQNTISVDLTRRKPKVDGFITSFRPALRPTAGSSTTRSTTHAERGPRVGDLGHGLRGGERARRPRHPRGRHRLFDSGEPGFGPPLFTAGANRVARQTPAGLASGTSAYFGRVHPFMRGAFRVKG